MDKTFFLRTDSSIDSKSSANLSSSNNEPHSEDLDDVNFDDVNPLGNEIFIKKCQWVYT